MSVKISALKKSKILVYEYLKSKYTLNKFSMFYSIGQKEDDYLDQHLKVETDINPNQWSDLKNEISDFLTNIDQHYVSIRIRISPFKQK